MSISFYYYFEVRSWKKVVILHSYFLKYYFEGQSLKKVAVLYFKVRHRSTIMYR